MSSINGQNIERMRVNGNEIELAKINGNVVFQKNKLLKTFFGDSKQNITKGYNELEPKMKSTTRLGITCTNNDDGTFTLNGTATSEADFRINQSTVLGIDNLINLNGEYTLKCDELIEGVRISVVQNETFSFKLSINSNEKSKNFNFENVENCFIVVFVNSGTTLNNLTIKPLFYKGTEDKEYEPYTGGIPSPNPDYPQQIKSITGASLKLTGKNLFNINKYVEDDSNYYSLENDNLICEVIDSRTQGFVYTSFEKGTYTVSTTNVCNISIHEENNNYLFIQKQNVNKFTFTLEENKKLHFKFFSSNVPYEIGKVQIEKGYQATNYESYKSQTIPVNLQGNILSKVGDYADELQVYSNGDINIVKKISKRILDNTTGYVKSSYSTFEYFKGYILEGAGIYLDNKKVMNTHFQSGMYSETSEQETLADKRQLHIQILASRLSENSADGLREWLGNNNVIALCPLVDSTTTKVDNIKSELNSFGDYSNIEIETTYS